MPKSLRTSTEEFKELLTRKASSVSLKLPVFLGADDKHEFDIIDRSLRSFGVKLVRKEVDFDKYLVPSSINDPYVSVYGSSLKEINGFLKGFER